MTTLGRTAPCVRVDWTATALTTSWRGYRVYRRRSSGMGSAWQQIADIDSTADTGAAVSYTNAEAHRTWFCDYEAAPAPTRWDYAVTVVRDDGAESLVTAAATQVEVAAADRWWFAANVDPAYNVPVDAVMQTGGTWDAQHRSWAAAGRDGAVVARSSERPPQRRQVGFRMFDGSDVLAGGDNLAESLRSRLQGDTAPQQWAFVSPLGDVWWGTPELQSVTVAGAGGVVLDGQLAFVETGYQPTVANWQGPSQLRSDGTSGYITYGDLAAFDFGAGDDFTCAVAAVMRSTQGPGNGLIGKQNSATGGWGLVTQTTSDGRVDFHCTTSTATGTTGWNDDRLHVFAGRRDAGTSVDVWTDGAQQGTAADGDADLSSAHSLTVGSLHTSGIANCNYVAWAVWDRKLSDAEMVVACEALHGTPGFEIPGGTTLAVDMRQGSLSGTRVGDLSGNSVIGTVTGTAVWLPKGGG